MSDNAAMRALRDQLHLLLNQAQFAEMHVRMAKVELRECVRSRKVLANEIEILEKAIHVLERARKADYTTKRYRELRDAEAATQLKSVANDE